MLELVCVNVDCLVVFLLGISVYFCFGGSVFGGAAGGSGFLGGGGG